MCQNQQVSDVKCKNIWISKHYINYIRHCVSIIDIRCRNVGNACSVYLDPLENYERSVHESLHFLVI